MSDKLDTIAGIFCIGQKPTGTKDPYGLRRAALGILRTARSWKHKLDLSEVLPRVMVGETALGGSRCNRSRRPKRCQRGDLGLSDGTTAFLIPVCGGRRRPRSDYGNVRRRARDPNHSIRPHRYRPSGCWRWKTFLALPEAASLAAANKRIANILKKAGEQPSPRVDPGLLTDANERQLATEIESLRQDVERLVTARRYADALTRLASLRGPVDAFFEHVMVMADDVRVRANRLALLAALQRLFLHIANLSRLPG